jgi:hypothetical protein
MIAPLPTPCTALHTTNQTIFWAAPHKAAPNFEKNNVSLNLIEQYYQTDHHKNNS